MRSLSTVSPKLWNPLAPVDVSPTSASTGFLFLLLGTADPVRAPRNDVSHNVVAQLITQRSINRQVKCALHAEVLNRQVPVVAGANPARCTFSPLKNRQLAVAGINPHAGDLLARVLGFLFQRGAACL